MCRVCEGPTRGRFALCYCCRVLVRQLQMPLVPMVAVADYRVGDALHRRLRGYKDAPVARGPGPASPSWSPCSTPGWTPAGPGCAVDSARVGMWWQRCRPPIVRRALRSMPSCPGYLRSTPSTVRCWARPAPTGHLAAARRGFALGPGVDRDWLRHQTVLVVDDSVVTGARAQSAAAALRLGGARVAGVVAVGRAMARQVRVNGGLRGREPDPGEGSSPPGRGRLPIPIPPSKARTA